MRVPIRLLASLLAILTTVACARGGSRHDPASRSRLLQDVRALADQIGPRPAGSPAEARARRYILEAMQSAGLQASEQPLGELELWESTDLALNSANVIGVLPGSVGGSIVVGAHHDSRSPACPGAADDASGVAVVLEAARRWAKKDRRHTLVFASFTGEETFGLPGSAGFLKHWEGPRPLAALTLDFVSTGKIFVAPFPRPPELWANRLLARAEARARTGRTTFDPWLVAVPRLLEIPYFADHASFLEAGIPALNLSCQFPAWIYHTREDTPERVEGETLVAAADLVTEMIGILDRGEADLHRSDKGYVPVPAFGSAFFLPLAGLRALEAAVVLAAMIAAAMRRREVFRVDAWGETLRALFMAVPFTLLGISGGLGVESLLGRIAGVLHPSAAHPVAHVAGAVTASAFTFWVAAALFRFVRPATRPGPYLAAGWIVLAAEAATLSGLGRHETAFPLWTGAAGMLLASSSGSAVRQAAWGCLGALVLLSYLSPVTYRMFLELSGSTVPPAALWAAAFALLLPWFLFFQGIACHPEVLLSGRPGRLLSAPAGIVLALLAAALAVGNAMIPVHDSRHRTLVQVSEELDLTQREVKARLASLEPLSAVRLEGWDSPVLSAGTRQALDIPWDRIDPPAVTLDAENGDTESLVRLRGLLPGNPRLVSLRLASPGSFQVFRGGSWGTYRNYRKTTVSMEREIQLEVPVRKAAGVPVHVEAEIILDEDILGLRPRSASSAFRFWSRLKLVAQLP